MKNSSDLFKKSFNTAAAGLKTLPNEVMKSVIKMQGDMKEEQKLEGGLADKLSLGDISTKHKVSIEKLTNEFLKGVKVELEHTKNEIEASEIAMDHLSEDPKYYTKLKKIESDESTEDVGKSAKRQFSKDLQNDPDYVEFKKNAKFRDGSRELSFGTPNVSLDDPYIKKKKYVRVGKDENNEATGSGSSGAYSGPLFSGEEPESVNEQIFQNVSDFFFKKIPDFLSLVAKIYNGSKYKSKKEFPNDPLKQDAYRHILASALSTKMIGPKITSAGGYVNEVLGALKNLFTKGNFDSGWVMDEKNNKIGINLALRNLDKGQDFFEMFIKKIVSEGNFFDENGNLYSNSKSKDIVKKEETKEATTSGSVGAYETPAFLAKSTKKKDFRGASKPLYKGGAFVSVKKKCTKFPYCNTGDINALDIYENENLKEAIQNITKNHGLSENTVKAILQYELEKLNKKDIYK